MENSPFKDRRILFYQVLIIELDKLELNRKMDFEIVIVLRINSLKVYIRKKERGNPRVTLLIIFLLHDL